MLKNYTALLNFQENIQANNISQGTANTKTAANKITERILCVFMLLKIFIFL
jgi:hypothetical protein